jgi:hypothetical protein
MLKADLLDHMAGGTIVSEYGHVRLPGLRQLTGIVQELAEGLEVEASSSGGRMGEVIEEDGRVRRRKIGLVHPSVFPTSLPFDEPCIVQEAAMDDECIQMKPLCSAFERHLPIHVRRLLFL